MASCFDFLWPFPALRRAARTAMDEAEDNPNHALYEIRRFGEKLTTLLYDEERPDRTRSTHKRQQRLNETGVIPDEIFEALTRCRREGNEAVHEDADDPRLVRQGLQDIHDLGSWYVRRHGGPAPDLFVPDAVGRELTPEEQERQVREQLHLEQRVPMEGLATRVRRTAPDVGDLFVPPRFDAEPRYWHDLVSALQTGQRIAISGPGGSGKSTLSRALVRTLSSDPTAPIPLYLPLGSLDEALRPGLVRRVREQLFVRLEARTLEDWMEEGRVVLILDGLDETHEPSKLADALDAAATRYPKLGILLTSRPTPLDRVQLKTFTRIRIADWTYFEAKWFLERFLGADEAEAIVSQLDYRRGLHDFLSQPLLVTLVGMVWQEHGELPEERGALLDAAIRTMLDTWPARRGRSFRGLPVQDQHRHAQLLARSSLQPDFDSSFSGLQRVLGLDLLGERWLEHLIDETGLLVDTGDRSYRFCHQAIRDRLALAALRSEGVDLVTFVVQQAGGADREALIVDLVATERDRGGLARDLISEFIGRPLPDYGAWYGVSRGWWLGLFQRLVREGLVLDDEAAEELMLFLAEDRLRVFRAMSALEPMRIGDEHRMAPHLGDTFGILLHHAKLGHQPTDFLPKERVASWLEPRLRTGQGESLAAGVALSLESMDDEQILGTIGERVSALVEFWPRIPAGRLSGVDEVCKREDPWPGDRIALAAGRHAGMDEALAAFEGGSDWLGRSLSYMTVGGGSGLLEAIVVMIVRQAVSLGFAEQHLLPSGDRVLRSGPWPCVHQMAPQLGVEPQTGMGGELERFRGPVWLGWQDKELESIVVSTGMRTPVSLVRIESERDWPDTAALDALPLSDLPGAAELHRALASTLGMLSPTVLVSEAETGMWKQRKDEVALTLYWSQSGIPVHYHSADRMELRQTWLAETIAASVMTRGMSEPERARHLQHRLQCRAVSNLWNALEKRALARPEPGIAELLLPAMLWAQRSLTGTWPVTPWVERFLDRRHDRWLTRLFHLMIWSEHPRMSTGARAQLRRERRDLARRHGRHPATRLLRGR